MTKVKGQLVAETTIAPARSCSRGRWPTRREVADAPERVVEWRGRIVLWVRVAAVAHALAWFWIGLGQLSLVGWGRRRFARRVPVPPAPVPDRPPP
jgi:hypothetical protein